MRIKGDKYKQGKDSEQFEANIKEILLRLPNNQRTLNNIVINVMNSYKININDFDERNRMLGRVHYFLNKLVRKEQAVVVSQTIIDIDNRKRKATIYTLLGNK